MKLLGTNYLHFAKLNLLIDPNYIIDGTIIEPFLYEGLMYSTTSSIANPYTDYVSRGDFLFHTNGE